MDIPESSALWAIPTDVNYHISRKADYVNVQYTWLAYI